MDKDCKLTLHYFNSRGRAELPRYILAYAKKQYTDHRVEKADWPAFKPQCPLGQMPVLEFTNKDGKSTMLCQSGAIVRHLANLFGLDGKTPQQKARADEAYESLHEMFELGVRAFLEQDPAKRAELMGQMAGDLSPRVFGLLEKRAKEGGGKNLAGGDAFTYADIALAQMMEVMMSMPSPGGAPKEEQQKMMQLAFPTILAIADAVKNTAQLKEYLAKRPQTDY